MTLPTMRERPAPVWGRGATRRQKEAAKLRRTRNVVIVLILALAAAMVVIELAI